MDRQPTQTDSDPGVALAPQDGPKFWRSLDELAGTPEFQEYLHREFPKAASEWHDPVSRRNFLKVMGASLALAGVQGCAPKPDEKIVPYVVPPEQGAAGTANYYATTMPFMGYGLGVLAESHEGRPTKIDGNPEHPASLGSTDIFAQASILNLYDPDRAQVVRQAGEVSGWTEFVFALNQRMAQKRKDGGAGLRLLTETITSPTLVAQLAELRKQFPQARIHTYEPAGVDNARAGAELAFGEPAHAVYHFDKAARVLFLDAEPLCTGPAGVRYARDFGRRRRVRAGTAIPASPTQSVAEGEMARLYVVETTPTPTGAAADHRVSVKPSEVEAVARAILAQIVQGAPAAAENDATARHASFIAALVKDLTNHRGSSLVVVGDHQPPAVHALGHAINAALGSPGATLTYTDPIEFNPENGPASLAALADDLRSGAIDTLFILSANPVYTAPADLNFSDALTKFSADNRNFSVHYSLYYDETSFRCQWHVPETHYLETWGDIRTFDGTASIIQPLISPLYQNVSPLQLLAALLGQPDLDPRQVVRNYWQAQLGNAADFEIVWRQWLSKGVIPDTAAKPKQVNLNGGIASLPATPTVGLSGMEIIFKTDPALWDGRFSNNAWLQELPKPLTKLVWDNVALISYSTSRKLDVKNEDVLRLRLGDRSVELPVWVLPGHPDEAVTVHLGFGRQRAGRVASGAGVNVYPLRSSAAMWFARGLSVERTGRQYPLACTQPHQMLEGRDHVRIATLEAFQSGKVSEKKTVHLSLYPEYDYSDTRKWAMSIDQTSCMGCNACVVACQSENNIPVVGKAEVIRGREMHWLRIDSYYSGSPEMPEGPFFQPMLCQHCEKAPCEYPCPVEATSHSNEGINEMTYNRCIGTRYCANNCPYKVRRFNFFQYSDTATPVKQLMYNPSVTVRRQGVMEKCTFCVQRVNETRIELKKIHADGVAAESPEAKARLLARAEKVMEGLQTACQQACPTQAIVFGDYNYKNSEGRASEVHYLHAQPHAYEILDELNTQPRVSYLQRIVNPNPALVSAKAGSAEPTHH